MKKVGIITYHNADNLGAVLQAFALQQTLENECNADAEIIDYRCDAIEKSKKAAAAGTVKEVLKSIPKRVYYSIKSRGFKKFRKEIKLSKDSYDKFGIAAVNDKYDILVFGSDQIWNPGCSGNDYTYFGDFSSRKKVSYAASIGEYEFDSNEKDCVNEMLSSFECISVRENSAREKLYDIGIESVFVHPDPVVLLKKEDWTNVMSCRLYRKKYVFVYLIQEDLRVLKSAEEYAKKNKLKVIYNKRSVEFIFHNSPREFLSWINYAECVFTNSFHGTMLSIIFKKHLASQTEFLDGKENKRVAEILKKTCLEKCILSARNDCGGEASADNVLAELRQSGIDYLCDICKGDNGEV